MIDSRGLAAIATGWIVLATAFGQEPPPPAVRGFAAELEQRVQESLELVPELTRAREDVLSVLRRYGRGARSWQLDPVLVRELSDDELFTYVSQRAEQTLVCGADILSRHALDSLEEQRVQAEEATRFFPEARSFGGLRMSWDCATLLDAEDRPATLRQPEQFRAGMSLGADFNRETARSLVSRKFTAEPMFQRNQGYLAEEYGGEPSEVKGFAEAAGFPEGTRVFEKRIINLTFYLGFREGDARLVFVAPLSN